jgi:hypothetical protein
MSEFKNYISEGSIGSFVKGIAGGVQDFARKFLNSKGGWLYNIIDLQDRGLLAKWKVRIITSQKAPQELKTAKNVILKTGSLDLRGKTEEQMAEALYLEAEETQYAVAEHPDPDVENVNASQLFEILNDHWQDKQPVFIWGPPGVGKTAIVEQVAKANGVTLIVFELSVRDPVDFIGLPDIKDGTTIYNPPAVFPRDNGPDGKGGILFFDEMNRANPSVINSSLRLVLDRSTGDYTLPSKWVIFAAGNRKTENPEVEDLNSALANRFPHYNYVITMKDWEKWAGSKEASDKEGRALVDPMIIEFLKFMEKQGKPLLHALPIRSGGYPPSAWPSPRSWVAASRAYLAKQRRLESEGKEISEEQMQRILAGHVGRSAAAEFIGFKKLTKYLNVDDIDKVYTNPDKAPLPPKSGGKFSPDAAYAILASIVFNKKNAELTDKNFDNVVKYGIRLDEMEYATYLIKLILSAHPYLRKKPEIERSINAWSQHYGKGLEDPVKPESGEEIKGKKGKKSKNESLSLFQDFIRD